ncbi:HMA domain-containing protein [Psidium guajava]|nr:HMA domain-containing protein [Psidium guajava]
MVKKTVLKVSIPCQKCKKKLLKAVSALHGVDKIEVDSSKGTLTVTGDVDPYDVVRRARKAGKYAEVMSIGPPPPLPKLDGRKKTEEKKPDVKAAQIHTPFDCPICQQMAVVHMPRWEEPNPSCSIM